MFKIDPPRSWREPGNLHRAKQAHKYAPPP